MTGLRQLRRLAAVLPATAILAAIPPPAAASLPVDCLADQVVSWQAAEPDAYLRFGAALLPGIVLGPPGPSTASTGSTSVASLGPGGSVTLAFADIVIEDRPGADFIVFENAFFVGAPPADASADAFIFAEPLLVEVSADGITWHQFPYDAGALAASVGSLVDLQLYAELRGLAGVTPTFSGNWTVPDDPDAWDAAGTGGVSGAGGDAFDLAQVGLAEARFVRLTDALTMNGAAGEAEGADLDAVVVLHGRPLPPAGQDSDGDRLPDSAEVELYLTDPLLADSDGDDIDDGRELAGCRDPGSGDTAAFVGPEPQLTLRDPACTQVTWTYPGAGRTADLLRGDLAGVSPLPAVIDLGALTCLASGLAITNWSCDADALLEGQIRFYLAVLDGGDAGRAADLRPRETGGACP